MVMITSFVFGIASLGLIITLVSGVMQGVMLTPMKYLRKWEWENIWIVFAFSGYMFLPWVFAVLTVPHLIAVYESMPTAVLLRTALYGAGWGCSAVLFGLGIRMVGLGLGYAIILGLATSAGALVPLATLHRDKLWGPAGLGTIAGVAMLITSVVLFSVAGRQREACIEKNREKDGATATGNAGAEGYFLTGLVLCILCGLLNPLINFALAYGAEIQSQAIERGASPSVAANAIWVIVANAGFIPNLVYCLYLLNRRRTWSRFVSGTLSYWILVPGMGFMWITGTVLYGVGATWMGHLGPVVGWPLLMCSMILAATFCGFVSGEWKGVVRKPIRVMTSGIVVLVSAIAVLGWSSRL
jgi:L-rhamnose-H+ transport protein